MNEIRAFIGHSFLEDDKPLVDAFLKSLDSLTKIVPHFSWDSASAAEPKELSAKVLSLVESKNVFIGICTRRERVIEDRHLQSTGIMRGYLKAKAEEFQWKTTDWLLQEIGMAKGLGLDLILLVENGVRPPGGLQGDVEYIKFDRDAPHKAFDKIIEMVAALTPKKAGARQRLQSREPRMKTKILRNLMA